MESVRVALATASAGPVTPARDGRGRVPCEKPAYGCLSACTHTQVAGTDAQDCTAHALQRLPFVC